MVFVCHRTASMVAVYQLKINYDQDKFEVFFIDAKRFPLKDKHVVNKHDERHVVRKSHDATLKKCLQVAWCISMHYVIGLKQTRGIKNVTLKAAKKFVGVVVYWEE